MGLFSKREVLNEGTIVLRVNPADGFLQFTLDPEGAPRRWYAGRVMIPPLPATTSLEDAVRAAFDAGMAAVQRIVPSLQDKQLQVGAEQTEHGVEVIAFGNLRYLRSEWDAASNKITGGLKHTPQSGWGK
jgi:hypothetical protein